jgi:hypothetical protein
MSFSRIDHGFQLPSLEKNAQTIGNSLPGKVFLIRNAASRGKILTKRVIGQNADQGTVEFIRLVRGHQHDSSISDRRACFKTRISDYRTAASDGGDRATSTRRDVTPNKQKYVYCGKSLHDFLGIYDSLDCEFYRQPAESIPEIGLMEIGTPPKD